MSDVVDSQHLLGSRLKEAVNARAMDLDKLAKRVLVSRRQLNGLFTGLSEDFHTYGLYLKALRRALDEVGKSGEAEVEDDYAILMQHYQTTPRGKKILEVQRVVNKALGEAPAEDDARQTGFVRVTPWLVVGIITVAVVMTLSGVIHCRLFNRARQKLSIKACRV
ncbi:MAG: hypothetical protein R6V42_02880 [Orrella sp.]